MRKILLSVGVALSTAFAGMANEYTFVFDGDNDMGGLTRQSTTQQADLTFSDSFSLSEEGIELTVKVPEMKLGLALINAGGTNAGLCVYSSMTSSQTPEIILSVPGGKISGVKMYMSGSAMSALDIDMNGKGTESVNEGALYYWLWQDSKGAENVTITWTNSYYARYIHSIEVSYTPDLGGKQECGLIFGEKEYETILGEDFNAPTLSNPHDLDISWSSSDENVATIDATGKLSVEGRGTTTITAATAGNDEYAAGNAKYTLTVIPSATNITELLEYAPDVFDRVLINFPVTVTFANASIAFVTDAEGNAACIDDIRNRNSTSTTVQTIYKVGDVIPAGWMATNATIYESVIWEGIPDKVTETVEVAYPVVNAVTEADTDKVVVLKDVSFERQTPEGNSKGYGTTPDGTRYEFQNIYGTDSTGAGTYNVTCVVRYSKRGSTVYFFLAPISFEVATPDGIETIMERGKSVYYDLNGRRTDTPKRGIFVKTEGGKTSKVLRK